MAYELRFDVKGDILWVTATGTRSLQTVISMAQDILAACVEKNVNKVLVDVIGLEGRLKTIEAYDITTKHFPRIRDYRVIARCAIVDLKKFEESFKFFENVAVNQGFRLRIFPDTEKAITWLTK